MLESAISDFTRVIPEEKAQEITAVVHLGTCYMYNGELQKAEDEFRLAAKLLDSLETAPPHLSVIQQALRTKNSALFKRREKERAEKGVA